MFMKYKSNLTYYYTLYSTKDFVLYCIDKKN